MANLKIEFEGVTDPEDFHHSAFNALTDKAADIVQKAIVEQAGIDDEAIKCRMTLSRDGHFVFEVSDVSDEKMNEILEIAKQTGEVPLVPKKPWKPVCYKPVNAEKIIKLAV